MSTPFMSEIRIMAFGFAPKGWALCNGQSLPINQNQALYSLLGVVYGGNGVTTFSLPNLQGRVPVSLGGGLALGAMSGEEGHALTPSEIPSHNHGLAAKAAAAPQSAAGRTPAPAKALAQADAAGTSTNVNLYGTGSASVAFASDAVGNNPGGQAHENRQPYLALNFCIALAGIYPPRN